MNKALAFFYGLVAYSLSMVAIVYAIGFVGNVVVPKSIDSGTAVSLTGALLVNMGLLILFAVPHSIMARPAFKQWWCKFVPSTIERSTFVLITSLSLFLIFWQWRPMTGVVWNVENTSGSIALWTLYCFGWAVVFLSTFIINHFDLFGMRQVYLHLKGKTYGHLDFKVSLFYRFVRHPLLLGFMIAFWATPHMTTGHLVYALGTTVYMLVAVQLEERDLVRFHGEAYRDYQRRVPMLVPFSNGKGAYVTETGENFHRA